MCTVNVLNVFSVMFKQRSMHGSPLYRPAFWKITHWKNSLHWKVKKRRIRFPHGTPKFYSAIPMCPPCTVSGWVSVSSPHWSTCELSPVHSLTWLINAVSSIRSQGCESSPCCLNDWDNPVINHSINNTKGTVQTSFRFHVLVIVNCLKVFLYKLTISSFSSVSRQNDMNSKFSKSVCSERVQPSPHTL